MLLCCFEGKELPGNYKIMILYNVTVNVEKEIATEWLAWMKESHIPAVLGTGMFTENKIFRLLNETENDGETFSVQYFARTIADIETYLQQHAPALIASHNNRYRHKHVAFRTVMEQV